LLKLLGGGYLVHTWPAYQKVLVQPIKSSLRRIVLKLWGTKIRVDRARWLIV